MFKYLVWLNHKRTVYYVMEITMLRKLNILFNLKYFEFVYLKIMEGFFFIICNLLD